MKMVICAVRDRAVAAFFQPIFVPAVGAAIRGFQDQINRADETNMLYKHPDDYDLFELGVYDDSTAQFQLLESPKQIAVGKQCVIPK